MTLTPLCISGIKRDKLALIINTLLSYRGITRTELASLCGVSTVTAGKVVSAMLDAGYATVSKDYDKGGRYLDHIYPSATFKFFIIEMSDKTMSATVYDALENIHLSYSQPRNESIQRDIDEAAFISLTFEHTRALRERSTCLSAIIYSGKEPTLDGMPIFSRKLAAAEYVSNTYPHECVLLVGAQKHGDITIISDGKTVNGKHAPRRAAKEITSELDLLEHLGEELSTLFSFIIPDTVVIDVTGLSVTRRFGSALSEMLCERYGIEKEKLPKIVTSDGISPSSRAVIGQLTLEYSRSLAAL